MNKRQSSVAKFFIFLTIVVGGLLLGKFLNIDIDTYKAAFAQFPLWLSGIIFIVSYVVTVTFIWIGPRDIYRLIGAIFYGPVVSTFLVVCADLITAGVLFHLSRFLGRDFIEERFRPSQKDLNRAKVYDSVVGITALRLNPLVPFSILDLSYGLTPISFKKYLFISFPSTFIRVFWLQSILSQVGDAVFKDINFVLEYLVNHPFILYYSGIYFLTILILSLWAVALSATRYGGKSRGKINV